MLVGSSHMHAVLTGSVPKAQCTAGNLTEVFSSVSHSALNRRRNRRSAQVLHNRDTLVNLPINAMSVGRRPSQSQVGLSPVQCTAENWTERSIKHSDFSLLQIEHPVPVQFSAMHWASHVHALAYIAALHCCQRMAT